MNTSRIILHDSNEGHAPIESKIGTLKVETKTDLAQFDDDGNEDDDGMKAPNTTKTSPDAAFELSSIQYQAMEDSLRKMEAKAQQVKGQNHPEEERYDRLIAMQRKMISTRTHALKLLNESCSVHDSPQRSSRSVGTIASPTLPTLATSQSSKDAEPEPVKDEPSYLPTVESSQASPQPEPVIDEPGFLPTAGPSTQEEDSTMSPTMPSIDQQSPPTNSVASHETPFLEQTKILDKNRTFVDTPMTSLIEESVDEGGSSGSLASWSDETTRSGLMEQDLAMEAEGQRSNEEKPSSSFKECHPENHSGGAKHESSERRFKYTCVAISFIAVALLAGLAVVLIQKFGSETSNSLSGLEDGMFPETMTFAPSPSPNLRRIEPTMEPIPEYTRAPFALEAGDTTRLRQLQKIIGSYFPDSESFPSSGIQSACLHWAAYSDPYSFEIKSDNHYRLLERFVFATLYSSTRGVGWLRGIETAHTEACMEEKLLCGRTPGSIVTEVDLTSRKINGPIPTELGLLSALTHLELGQNSLDGAMPSELGRLTQLTWLSLYENKLSGPLPSELGYLRKLVHLDLGSNELEGSIPEELTQLTSLEHFEIEGNSFSGSIP